MTVGISQYSTAIMKCFTNIFSFLKYSYYNPLLTTLRIVSFAILGWHWPTAYIHAEEVGSYKRRVLLTIFVNEHPNQESEYLGISVPDAFSTPLVNTGNFIILNRNSVDSYIATMGIARQDLFREENAIRLGRAVGADVVLVGRFVTNGSEVTIVAKAIDVRAGALSVQDSEQVKTNASMFHSINSLAGRMSGPMAQKMQPTATPPPPAEVLLEKKEVPANQNNIETMQGSPAINSPVVEKESDRMRLSLGIPYYGVIGKLSELLSYGIGANAAIDVPYLRNRLFNRINPLFLPHIHLAGSFLAFNGSQGVTETAITGSGGFFWTLPLIKNHRGQFTFALLPGVTYLTGKNSSLSLSTVTFTQHIVVGYEYPFKDWFAFGQARYSYFYDVDFSLQGFAATLGVGYNL